MSILPIHALNNLSTNAVVPGHADCNAAMTDVLKKNPSIGEFNAATSQWVVEVPKPDPIAIGPRLRNDVRQQVLGLDDYAFDGRPTTWIYGGSAGGLLPRPEGGLLNDRQSDSETAASTPNTGLGLEEGDVPPTEVLQHEQEDPFGFGFANL